MRLLIIGALKGQLSVATRIAMDRGAAVTNAETIEQALAVMRSKGADLVMIDVVLPVHELVQQFEAERIRTPVVACGTGTDTRAAVLAIQAGAREYIPLPPDPELIAAVLEAVSRDNRTFVFRDETHLYDFSNVTAQVARNESLRPLADGTARARAGAGTDVAARRPGQPVVPANP